MEDIMEDIKDRVSPAAAEWLDALIKKERERPRAGPCQLWKVTYPDWNGIFIEGYTSREDCANLCKDHFGWAVEEEYAKKIDKYKSFDPCGQWLGLPLRGAMDVNAPPKQEQSSIWCNPPDNFNAPNPGEYVEDWAKVWIQLGCKCNGFRLLLLLMCVQCTTLLK